MTFVSVQGGKFPSISNAAANFNLLKFAAFLYSDLGKEVNRNNKSGGSIKQYSRKSEMKRFCFVILLFFTSFASLQAERIGRFEPIDPNRAYVVERNSNGTIVGRPEEPFSLTKLVVTGLGILVLAIFGSSSR